MPETFGENPVAFDYLSNVTPISSQVEDISPSDTIERLTGKEDSLFVENFSKRVNTYIATEKMNFHGTEQEERELDIIFDAMFGPFRRYELEHANPPLDESRVRAISARSQQVLAHHFLYGATHELPNKYTQNLAELFRMYEHLSQRSRAVERYWNGAKAQAKGVKLLHDLGLSCVGPSVREDPLEYSETADEVYKPVEGLEIHDWDVKKGIDAIFKLNGDMFFVDFKSSNSKKATFKSARRTIPIDHVMEKFPKSVVQEVTRLSRGGITPDFIFDVELQIPYKSHYGDAYDADDPRSYLNSVLTCDDDERRSALKSLVLLQEKYYNLLT